MYGNSDKIKILFFTKTVKILSKYRKHLLMNGVLGIHGLIIQYLDYNF